MKKSIMLIALITMVTTLFAIDQKKESKTTKGAEETVVFIADLHCKACVSKLEKNLPYEKGVKGLKVDEKNKTIAITFKNDKNSVGNLKAAIEKLDIKVLGLKGDKNFPVCGKSCGDPKCGEVQQKKAECADKNCDDCEGCGSHPVHKK